MASEHTNSYSEVYSVLRLMEEEYVNRVPKKLRDFFASERNADYDPTYDPNISLTKQHIRRESIILLAILSLNYWCDSKEEKIEMMRKFSINEVERQKIKDNYNLENLVEKDKGVTVGDISTNEEQQEEKQEEKPKINIFQLILTRIKQFINNAFIGDGLEDEDMNQDHDQETKE